MKSFIVFNDLVNVDTQIEYTAKTWHFFQR